jgi:DNA polymerase III epsilon subunit-like protein
MRKLTVIFDLETSGFSPLPMFSNYHRILQICATALETGATFTRFVNPGGAVPPPSSAIHHITDADVRDAPEVGEVLRNMEEFFAVEEYDVVEMVAHNCWRFDEPILRKEYRAAGRPVPTAMVFWDTLPFCRRKYPGLPGGHSLGALYKHFYKKDFDNAHRADADVAALQRLYKDHVEPHRDTLPPPHPVEAECFVSLSQIGPYRACLLVEKLNLMTVSDLRDYWKVETARDPASLDNFLRNDMGVSRVADRMTIVSQVLEIPLWEARLRNFLSLEAPEDCLDAVDYYVKHKFYSKDGIKKNAHWYNKGRREFFMKK